MHASGFLISFVLGAMQVLAGGSVEATSFRTRDHLGSSIEEILRAHRGPGSIEVIETLQDDSDRPPCEKMTLSFINIPLVDLTGIAGQGGIYFCIDPSTYRAESISVVVHSSAGAERGISVNDFVDIAGDQYRVSRRPFIDISDGLMSEIDVCEKKDGGAEVWIFPELLMEAYVERNRDNEARVVSYHVGKRFGGTYPPCSDSAEH